LYCSFFYLVFVFESLAVAMNEKNGSVTGSVGLAFNIVLVFAVLGFLSSARYGIDAAAAKHVAASFRFLTIAALLCMWVSDYVRSAYVGNIHPSQAAAAAVAALMFLLTLLFDCSPRLPAVTQVAVSVIARRMRFTQRLTAHSAQQAGFCLNFGYWAFFLYERVLRNEHGYCWNIGAYRVCSFTQRLSIFSSLFLLMAQASVWRMLVPGMSNFVNASVRPSACARGCCAALALRACCLPALHHVQRALF
jgi:hypothetical protein